jgi:NAD(P)-dependent dehydrogenase (short-subunit alcohol dehydrogenase family)
MSTESSRLVWLITGCSSGLGYELCKAALRAGQNVIASSRDPTKTPLKVAEIEALGGHWITLDVVSKAVESQMENAISKFGRIDVLVNNAAYGMGATVEDVRWAFLFFDIIR